MYVPILTWILLTLENYALFTWNQNVTEGTSLVAQWLRIHLPMQGTQVQSLVREDPTCTEQLSPCATTTEPVL